MDLILLAQHDAGLDQAKHRLMEEFPNCNISTVTVDMGDVGQVEDSLDMIVERFSDISILINSAGVLRLGASEVPAGELAKMLTINLTSTLIIANKVAEQMKLARNGHIFNIASLAGLEHKSKLAVYASSKAGLISYSLALYKALLPFNANVTCLCPSIVNTEMTDDGRMKKQDKIQVEDIVLALKYVLSLGASAAVPRLDIHCKFTDLEQF